jgi:hypothetical protein
MEWIQNLGITRYLRSYILGQPHLYNKCWSSTPRRATNNCRNTSSRTAKPKNTQHSDTLPHNTTFSPPTPPCSATDPLLAYNKQQVGLLPRVNISHDALTGATIRPTLDRIYTCSRVSLHCACVSLYINMLIPCMMTFMSVRLFVCCLFVCLSALIVFTLSLISDPGEGKIQGRKKGGKGKILQGRRYVSHDCR